MRIWKRKILFHLPNKPCARYQLWIRYQLTQNSAWRNADYLMRCWLIDNLLYPIEMFKIIRHTCSTPGASTSYLHCKTCLCWYNRDLYARASTIPQVLIDALDKVEIPND
jgi:hypothetical protein